LDPDSVLARELDYHERLYSGPAQEHFSKPAVRALRLHMARRILRLTAAGGQSRVLSLGCGIGDTEIVAAPHVGELVGIDLSPAAIRQAQADARLRGLANTKFREGTIESADLEAGSFDAVFAVFFLHHLPGQLRAALPRQVANLLRPGGYFYSVDPSRFRLSGAIGSLLVPGLMRKYQSPDEEQLHPEATARGFREAGFTTRAGYYDFFSSPLAGLLPSSARLYRLSRLADDVLIRIPGIRLLGSNFEIVARTPWS
jgi:SAM-dependent methyltransferase